MGRWSLMYAQQRDFLVQARQYVMKKALAKSLNPCDIEFKMSRITTLNEGTKQRIAEELSAQGYIVIERRSRKESIKKFKFTELGLEALRQALESAGKVTYNIVLDINPTVLDEIDKLIEAIRQINDEHRDVLLEIAEALRDEANSVNPKKNVIAILFSVLAQVVSLSSNITTIAGAAGLDISSIPDYISSRIK